jgi:hypothetical protein
VTGQALSPRERRILAALETDLRREEEDLDFALRTMLLPKAGPLGRLLDACGRMQADWLVLLAACGIGFGSLALQVRTPAAISVLCVLWTLTVVLAVARTVGRRRRDRN